MKERKQPDISYFQLPDTTEVERLVLADAITAPDTFGDVSQLITPDFFTAPARVRLWKLITDRYNAGAEISPTAISNVAGLDYFDEVMPKATEAGMRSVIPEHAIMLRDGAAKRRACIAASAFVQAAVNPAASEQDVLTALESLNRDVEGPAPMRREQTLAEVLKDVRAEAEQTQEALRAGKNVRVTTGFSTIDKVMNGGMKAGHLVIIAARPSVGKTALMLQMAKAAAQAGNPAIIYTLEMPSNELGERLMYSTGEVRPYQFNYGQIVWENYKRGELALNSLPIYINDFSRSLDEIISRTTQAVKQGRCKVIFIDYLGLMADALNFGNAKLYQVLGRITGTLKAVAKRLGIPIVLLCQLNREQDREDRAPELFDLRDSGSIEQDADEVMMLTNKLPENFEAKPGENPILVYLRKLRGGQKNWCFVLVPNDTYSAFREDTPIPPKNYTQPLNVPPARTEQEQSDEYPF